MSYPTYSLSLLKVPVNDVAESAKFYGDVIGLKQQFVAAEYGWAQFNSGELNLALYEPGKGGGNREPGGSVDFHLELEALDELEARLKWHGFNIFGGIVKSNDGLDMLEVEDPSGNILKFIEKGENHD